MWLVVQRELRELARRPVLSGTRILGAGFTMAAMWLAWERAEPGPGTGGRGFFYGLNRLLFLAIWLLAPVLTADCLSREKREGTLGLLMLTPLRPIDVVVGKALSQAVFAATFVLAALPVLIVPVLLGGVLWLDAFRMFLYQMAALGLALASGLAASSVTTSGWRARLGALSIAGATGFVLVVLHLSFQHLLRFGPQSAGGTPASPSQIYRFEAAGLLSRFTLVRRDGFEDWWRDWPGVPTTWTSVHVALGVAAGAWLLVGLMVGLASFGIQCTWRDNSGELPRTPVPGTFSGIQFRRYHRVFQERLLGQNPIRWMQSRTWDLRISGWLLAAGGVVGWWLGTDPDFRAAEGFVRILRPAFLCFVAYLGTSSFRMERKSGAFELWLVTPLRPETILLGRLNGILARTCPAAVVLIALPYLPSLVQWFSDVDFSPGRRQWLAYRMMGDLDFLLWVVSTALLGIALALSRISYFPAFGLTWVLHDAPSLGIRLGTWALESAHGHATPIPLPWDVPAIHQCSGLLGAGVVSLWSWGFARRALVHRRFLPVGGQSPLAPRDKPR
ncbi:MAG: ABC transporter permease subunit [Verrucomicrobiota bacterium]